LIREPEFSGAAIRNSEPILAVLRNEFADARNVLEIGSGTAQHAVHFATALPELDWQTSDLEEYHELIGKRLAGKNLANVRLPLLLDMESPPPAMPRFDAVYSCNTMHIMSLNAVENMLPFIARTLRRGGVFCYYGAFRRAGRYSTDSNAAFDRNLRSRDPRMGLRDLEVIDGLAAQCGLVRERLYAMPANNLLVTWIRSAS
jgi:SAM-dependent methyltransferase